jgi:hypothetical protein
LPVTLDKSITQHNSFTHRNSSSIWEESMKRLVVAAVLVFVAVFAWRIGEKLSADALGMAAGVLFGVLAGVPMALFALAGGRRRDREEEVDSPMQRRQMARGYPGGYGQYSGHPPVIVLAGAPHAGAPAAPYGGQPYGHPQYPALPPPQTLEARHFKVVGEKEEWVDEW